MAEVKLTTDTVRKWIKILETDGIGSKLIMIEKLKELLKK